MLRWIKDKHRNAVMNMSIDEMLFNEYSAIPVLRTYCWDNSYTTIGYFQKAKDVVAKGFVRRFTSGLMVNHQHDVSYCFVASSKYWNVYDQNETYKIIHSAIKKALQECGIYASMLEEKMDHVDNICINTFYTNDLVFQGKKIVGSCLRRRGDKFIVQGSIHVHLEIETDTTDLFLKLFAKNLSATMNKDLTETTLKKSDIEKALIIAEERYSNALWNNKY
jgi:lipoate-protein ligase A